MFSLVTNNLFMINVEININNTMKLIIIISTKNKLK